MNPCCKGELAAGFHRAINAAEKRRERDFELYPFVLGYLLGNLDDADIAAINSRLDALAGIAR